MFKSYAQNLEDVLLWRALKSVQNGFYIDIGAQDPTVDSVSRGFFEQGWRGVSVEPVAAYSAKLSDQRVGEIVIEAAVGTADGEIPFFEFGETGLSTACLDIAERHVQQGFSMQPRMVPVIPLSAVFEIAGEREIHWLKIDVEGMEGDVLDSWGVSAARPWIVVIESTVPMTQLPTHEAWEPALLSRDYRFVFFDGLNRYYCHASHGDLAANFAHGPTVFDAFEISPEARTPWTASLHGELDASRLETARIREQLAGARRELTALRAESRIVAARGENAAAEFERQLDMMRSQLSSLENDRRVLADTRSSHSWRLTAPLRVVSLILRGKGGLVANHGMRLSKRWAKIRITGARSWFSAHPRMKSTAISTLNRFPSLRDRLHRVLQSIPADLSRGDQERFRWSLSVDAGRVEAWDILVAQHRAEPSNSGSSA